MHEFSLADKGAFDHPRTAQGLRNMFHFYWWGEGIFVFVGLFETVSPYVVRLLNWAQAILLPQSP
jgi:hypothetical protein